MIGPVVGKPVAGFFVGIVIDAGRSRSAPALGPNLVISFALAVVVECGVEVAIAVFRLHRRIRSRALLPERAPHPGSDANPLRLVRVPSRAELAARPLTKPVRRAA